MLRTPRGPSLAVWRASGEAGGRADGPDGPASALWTRAVLGLRKSFRKLRFPNRETPGNRNVHKAGKKCEARLWVAGRGTRVVWRSSSPHECAFILARLELYPCEIPTPKKGRAKPGEGQVRWRACRGSVRVLTPACSSRSHRRLASGRSARRRVR